LTIAFTLSALCRGLIVAPLRAVLAWLYVRVFETLALAWRGARRHPCGAGCTALLVTLSASLLGVSVPLALLTWALASPLALTGWWLLEPHGLRRLGGRPPSHLERERLAAALASAGLNIRVVDTPHRSTGVDVTVVDAAHRSTGVDVTVVDAAHGSTGVDVTVVDGALGCAAIEVMVVDAAEPWLGRGVRCLVLSRALLDLLEDRALAGLLVQASAQLRAASLVGELVVWLGNLPLLGAWYLSRQLVQLGRVLAIAVGASLVLPLVFWPGGFTRWAGRVFGAAIVGLLGAALLSSGLAAAGLGLLVAWAVVPGLGALLDWETRRAEHAADDATLEVGRGWELLEALETLAWAESVPSPAGPLGWLCRRATPLTVRADRIWRTLAQA